MLTNLLAIKRYLTHYGGFGTRDRYLASDRVYSTMGSASPAGIPGLSSTPVVRNARISYSVAAVDIITPPGHSRNRCAEQGTRPPKSTVDAQQLSQNHCLLPKARLNEPIGSASETPQSLPSQTPKCIYAHALHNNPRRAVPGKLAEGPAEYPGTVSVWG